MKTSKFLSTLIILSVLIISALTFTACGPAKIELTDSEKSPKGVALEDFLPEDIFMSFSLNNLDREQSAQLQTFKSYFPDDVDEIMAGALDELALEMEEVGLDYKEDVEPLFPENFKMIVAMTGDPKKDDPDVYFAITFVNFTIKTPVKGLILFYNYMCKYSIFF